MTASAGIAGWIEFLLLRRKLHQRIGAVAPSGAFLAKLWFSALISAAAAWAVKLAVGHRDPILVALVVLIPYGALYFLTTSAFRIAEAQAVVARFTS